MIARRLVAAPFAFLLVVAFAMTVGASPSSAASYTPITGEGSSWASNVIDDWDAEIVQQGIQVNFAATGSVAGLTGFGQGVDDFAASDLPYGVSGVTPDTPARAFASVPDIGGGIALMYNLSVGGQRLGNLKLSPATIGGIFAGTITMWDDPAIRASNPGIALPSLKITPVVRSDGTASTDVFTRWLSAEQPTAWTCGEVAFFTSCPAYDPAVEQAKSGDPGVAGVVHRDAGTIGYVNYTNALALNDPVAKVLNHGGYYVWPTASNVSVALLQATIGTDGAEGLSGVFASTDRRAYPISYFSTLNVPTTLGGGFTTEKGHTLGAYTQFALCTGQQETATLGYAPLPINLVQAGLDRAAQIPGADASTLSLGACSNPTFSADGTDTLAADAPYPDACDQAGAPASCVYGSATGGEPTYANTPRVAGTVRVGATVAVHAGRWQHAASYQVAWLSNGSVIPGARSPLYTIPARMLGKHLSVRLTAISSAGQRTTVTGPRTAPVAHGRLAIRGLRITGPLRVGHTVRVAGTLYVLHPEAATDLPMGQVVLPTPTWRVTSCKLQWRAAGHAIRGATAGYWTLRRAQRGKHLTVHVTARKAGYLTLVRTSPRSGVVRHR